MADGTKIEWTDATWNPITGCAVVSPGCTNCYAMKLAGTRLKNHESRKRLTKDTKAGPVWTGEVRFNRQWLDQPLRWTKPRMIFVCAHGDLFAEGVPDHWIDHVFAVMTLAPQHTFQVLTKRPERMREYMLGMLSRRQFIAGYGAHIWGGDRPDLVYETVDDAIARPLPNIWLGVSVEDQKRADERIPILLDAPATLRWISNEPSLGPIDWRRWFPAGRKARRPNGEKFIAPHFFMTKCEHCAWIGSSELVPLDHGWDDADTVCPNCHRSFACDEIEGLGWAVAGGESGPGARPMHPDWARSLRDQCAAAGVPHLFKQWGTYKPVDITIHEGAELADDWNGTLIAAPNGEFKQFAHETGRIIAMLPVGKKVAGRLLDGVEHNGFPEVRR